VTIDNTGAGAAGNNTGAHAVGNPLGAASAPIPSDPQISERPAAAIPGRVMLGIHLVLVIAGAVVISEAAAHSSPAGLFVLGGLLILLSLALAPGLVTVAPGEAIVVLLFGHYQGTIRADGLHWVPPQTKRRKISTKIRSHQTEVAKVNDADGNPIEIAAVVVWQVEDTAKAVFGVENLDGFVALQTETTVRQIASWYPYDDGEGEPSLRGSTAEVTSRLASELTQRVAAAGARVIEARLIRLAYAQEIAHAMLRRQQAGAMVAARQKIVEGAVGMVESALSRLDADGLVELDSERKAAMVSNMLVVLCSDHPTQPVVNTGTLYQ
jgi:regulator of protease activity HflC (stomatin/prohibitin superfamily)